MMSRVPTPARSQDIHKKSIHLTFYSKIYSPMDFFLGWCLVCNTRIPSDCIYCSEACYAKECSSIRLPALQLHSFGFMEDDTLLSPTLSNASQSTSQTLTISTTSNGLSTMSQNCSNFNASQTHNCYSNASSPMEDGHAVTSHSIAFPNLKRRNRTNKKRCR